jgi:hypothetical protein
MQDCTLCALADRKVKRARVEAPNGIPRNIPILVVTVEYDIRITDNLQEEDPQRCIKNHM